MGFSKVYILGLGQMGMSIANTLKINDYDGKIVAFVRHQHDEKYDFIDDVLLTENLYEYKPADFQNSIILICTPPHICGEYIKKMLAKTKNTNCIVSDVCSIKKDISLIPEVKESKNFISIHQMDGGNSVKNKPYCFKKKVLNYVITDNKPKPELVEEYKQFLTNFLNCENVEITSQDHDKIVAFTSHLQNLILSSYNNDLTSLNNTMWKDIFTRNKENIKHFKNIFLEKIEEEKNSNTFIEEAIFEVNKNIMKTEKIEIDEELYNPSLTKTMNLKNDKTNSTNFDVFVDNMNKFFEVLTA